MFFVVLLNKINVLGKRFSCVFKYVYHLNLRSDYQQRTKYSLAFHHANSSVQNINFLVMFFVMKGDVVAVVLLFLKVYLSEAGM